ncbi:MAG TPA: hypothetical protein VFC56_09305 [Stellaceae bacterium]|nr:hypothetical protein [Stellaceae bacterium]
MFDGILSRTDPNPHYQTSQEAIAPWRLFTVLVALAALSAAAAMLFPEAFAAPFEHF